MLAPNHKYIEISNTSDVSKLDELGRKVYSVIIKKDESDRDIENAYDIYKNYQRKAFIEALLFSEFSPKEISNILDIPESHIECYSKVFFDISIFKNKLDKIEYFELEKTRVNDSLKAMNSSIGSVTEENVAELESATMALKIMAVYLKFGKKYVYYSIGGRDVTEEDMINLIKMSIKESILTATFNKILNKNKEAKDWYRIASMLISSLKSVDNSKEKSSDTDDPLNVIKLKLDDIQKQILDINIGDVVG
ncbi:MAG: hypothetical protein QXQ43_02150 [Nitrososphaerota archaeon]